MSEQEKKLCAVGDPQLGDFLMSCTLETSHNRMVLQENKCGFGLAGICCKLCSNGPCRITKTAPKGVCGADADVIVTRNFLRSVAAGSACYIHLVENAAVKLRDSASKRAEIPGTEALERLADAMRVGGVDTHQKAILVADEILRDIYRPSAEKMQIVQKLAPAARIEIWNKLGIMPGGSKSEVFDAIVKTSTNLNSDPVNMLLHSLKLGISTGVYGLQLTCLLNDILTGEPEIHAAPAGLGVIDPSSVNILVIGHQRELYRELEAELNKAYVSERVKSAGAASIKIVGSTCVGNEFQQRCPVKCDSLYCGSAGNNFITEAALATGCIDLVLTEFNCILPGVDRICTSLNIPQICLDEVAKTKGAEMVSASGSDVRAAAEKILNASLGAYMRSCADVEVKKLESEIDGDLSKVRDFLSCEDTRGIALASLRMSGAPLAARTNPMAAHGVKNAVAGLSERTLKDFLGGSWKSLIELIVGGAVKGIAGVVGCSNLRTLGHDVLTIEMTKRLIEKDILVLSAGCTSGALGSCGLMSPEAASQAGMKLRTVCSNLGIPPVLDFGACLGIGRMEIVASEIASELGVDIPQLPLVVSAPQWLEEQALADGAFALALGLPLHLGSAPFVTGSDLVCSVLTDQIKSMTGGWLMIETDPAKSADLIESVIIEKRKGLGL